MARGPADDGRRLAGRRTRRRQVALVGDWNIAPENDDVWDMAVFAHSTHVSPPERAAFRGVVEAGFADVVRPYTPGPGVYTYWDYTQLRFPRREGMRIDFVLGSPALAGRVTGALIDREERKGKGASDHAPVIVDLARLRRLSGDAEPRGRRSAVRRAITAMVHDPSTYRRARLPFPPLHRRLAAAEQLARPSRASTSVAPRQ